jgi:hypothetical protein
MNLGTIDFQGCGSKDTSSSPRRSGSPIYGLLCLGSTSLDWKNSSSSPRGVDSPGDGFPSLHEHVKTQEYQEPGPSESQPAANSSDDVQTQQPDAATASTTNEDPGIGSSQPPEIAESKSEPAATFLAAQNTTDTPDNSATPTPQPELGATVTPQVDEHVKTQEYQEPGPSESQPAANPSDDVQTQQPDAATASSTNEDPGIGSSQPPEIPESLPGRKPDGAPAITEDEDFTASDLQPSATPEWVDLEQAAEVAGKSAIEVAAAGQRLSTPPPPPAMSSEPFPGWGHPELMKNFKNT